MDPVAELRRPLTALSDIAYFISSKNAGPHRLTIDIVFGSLEDLEYVAAAEAVTAAKVATAYNIDPADVTVEVIPAAAAIKVSFPRPMVAGDMGETDIYGAQQHVPVMNLPLEPAR